MSSAGVPHRGSNALHGSTESLSQELTSGRTQRKALEEHTEKPTRRFDLSALKSRIMRALDERALSNLFKKFYASSLCDRLLQTLLLYFVPMFQIEWLIKTTERNRKQNLEGFSAQLVAARIQELNGEVEAMRMEISPLYAELILKYAKYEKGQQDRKFFETMYEVLIIALDDAFSRLNKRADIEREVGAIFRTKHFNLYKRRNEPPRSVDTMAVKELYALKNDSANRVLNARMLTSLFEKPQSIGVTLASVSTSPLISQFITSPVVARSMLKDPEQRQKMVSDMSKSAMKETTRSRIQSAASTTRLDQTQGRSNVQGDSDAPLPSTAGLAGLGAAEAGGLPTDESFAFLAALKRSVKLLQSGSTGLLPQPSELSQQHSGSVRSFGHSSSIRSDLPHSSSIRH